jgi:PAS domain S-box-containing protein
MPPSEYKGLNLSALFEALLDAYLILDTDHRVVFANAAYLRMTGLLHHNVVGRSIFDIGQYGDKRQRAARNEWVSVLLDSLRPGIIEVSPALTAWWPSEGGAELTLRMWEVAASIIPSSEGAPSYIAWRVNDVTEREQRLDADRRERARLRSQAQLRQIVATEKQKELVESRQQLAQALEFANVGAWQRDLVTGEISCTDQTKRNLGLASDEVLNEKRLFDELIAPVDRDRVRFELASSIRSVRDYKIEYRVIWPDGTLHWLMVGGRAQYDEGGHATVVMGFVLDITARKQQEIEHARDAQRERVAREQSDANALAMDHFLAAVSHELRTPITVIANWAELLGRTGFEGGLPRATGIIQRNAKQLALMVNDLLDSGAIVTGKLSIEFAGVSLDGLVTEVTDELYPHAQSKGLQLRILKAEAVCIEGDAGRLKQVVWNLVHNAIKFTDRGSVDISVRREAQRATISVRDTGCGIGLDAIDRIFDRFEQVGSKTSGRVGGLGLGLWLVKTLVERHDGQIQVYSSGAGQGTTFLVSFPLVALRCV